MGEVDVREYVCVGGPANGRIIKQSDIWKDDVKSLSAVCHTADGQSHWYDFKDGQLTYTETLTSRRDNDNG